MRTLLLVLFFCGVNVNVGRADEGTTNAELYSSLDLEAAHVPGSSVSELTRLVKRHPKSEIRKLFPQYLAQQRFLIRFDDAPRPTIANSIQPFAEVSVNKIRGGRYREKTTVLILKIYSEFLHDPRIVDEAKWCGIWHEWTHLKQHWAIGPPAFKLPFEEFPIRTEEQARTSFLREVEAYHAGAILAGEMKYTPNEEPFKSYREGGLVGLQLSVAKGLIGWIIPVEFKDTILTMAMTPQLGLR